MITSEFTVKISHDELIGAETIRLQMNSILNSIPSEHFAGVNINTLRSEYVEPETVYSIACINIADENVEIPISVLGNAESIGNAEKISKLSELAIMGIMDSSTGDISFVDVPKAVFVEKMANLHWRDSRYIHCSSLNEKKYYKLVINGTDKYLVTKKDLSPEKIKGYACRLGKASSISEIDSVSEIDKVEYLSMKWQIEGLTESEDRKTYKIMFGETSDVENAREITFRTKWNFPTIEDVFTHAVRMNKIENDMEMVSVELQE